MIDAIKPVGNAEAAPNGFLTFYGGYGKLWQTESQNMVKGILDGTVAPAEFGPQYQSLITDKYWSDVLKAVNMTEDDVKNPQLQPKQS